MTLILTGLVLPLLFFLWWFWPARAESAPRAPHSIVLGQAPGAIEEVPRKVWSYWHSSEPPLVVQRCVENWRRHNPDYAVTLIHQGNLRTFVPEERLPKGFFELPAYRQSDWLRLFIVASEGGIWLDSSFILTRSLDWVRDTLAASGADYLGCYLSRYTQRDEQPIVDNWFFAAPPGGAFVSAWLREVEQAVFAQGEDNYLAALESSGQLAELRQGMKDPRYLICHVAAQVVRQRDPELSLQLLRAEDCAYFYQACANWRRPRFYRRLLFRRVAEHPPALIKLRGGERRKLEPYLERGLYWGNSLIGTQLSAGRSSARSSR